MSNYSNKNIEIIETKQRLISDLNHLTALSKSLEKNKENYKMLNCYVKTSEYINLMTSQILNMLSDLSHQSETTQSVAPQSEIPQTNSIQNDALWNFVGTMLKKPILEDKIIPVTQTIPIIQRLGTIENNKRKFDYSDRYYSDRESNKESDRGSDRESIKKRFISGMFELTITQYMQFHYLEVDEKNKSIKNINEFRNIKFCYFTRSGNPVYLYKLQYNHAGPYYIGNDKKLYTLDSSNNLVHAIHRNIKQYWKYSN